MTTTENQIQLKAKAAAEQAEEKLRGERADRRFRRTCVATAWAMLALALTIAIAAGILLGIVAMWVASLCLLLALGGSALFRLADLA